jgi:pimeloyl-ACP methyl ester carboxylesterase
MTTFALVHGAWHGAWCWERLTPELEARGHRVVAVDLPCDDPAATFETYADVVVKALEGEDERVVVVGHSLAGLTIPLIAARRPVSRLIYLCALVPMPGRSFAEQTALEPDTLLPEYQRARDAGALSAPDELGRTHWVDQDAVRQVLYADCSERDAAAAFERLRPQAQGPYAHACPIDAFPDTPPRTSIVCSDDRIVSPTRSRAIATGRLGADLIELPGSHSPFLSRPGDLAEVLHDQAEMTA